MLYEGALVNGRQQSGRVEPWQFGRLAFAAAYGRHNEPDMPEVLRRIIARQAMQQVLLMAPICWATAR